MKSKIGKVFVWAKVLENIGSAWFFASYILFLQSLGLSLWEASLLNTVYMSVSSLLDPFTGNLGDRIGQKRIYVIGLFFWSLSHLSYWMATGFWMCALSEAIGAIGHACISEALESWVKNHTTEEETHWALSQAGFWGKLAVIPTAILGGIVGSRFGLQWPWLLAGSTGMITLLMISWELRKYPEKSTTHVLSDSDLRLWTITKNAWKDPVMRRTFVVTAILFGCFQPFNMFWPVVFKTASGNSEWLGSIWTGIAVASAIGSKLAEKWKINSKGLAIIVLSIGIPMLITPIKGSWIWLILIPFLVHEAGRSMWLPVLWTYTNRRIANEVRTSVNSLRSSAGTVGATIGLLVSGMLTWWFSPVQVWAISASALIIVALWIWRWNHDD
ncbi:MAG: MFS transporter [Microgenomates group bacterium]